MGHPKLKATREIKIDFHPSELDDTIVPEESKVKAKDYLTSKKLAEDDIMLMLDTKVIYGYDYLYKDKKLILPEVNPITIFYANAVMSYGRLEHYKKTLLTESSEAGKVGKVVNLNHSGTFFQLAVNSIINLQATLESFANRTIPKEYEFIDKFGKTIINPTVTHKLYNTIPKIKNIDFKQGKYKKYNKCIDSLIQLRNDIIHLKPAEKTNTGYKGIYRNLLDFDFQKAIASVKMFINFYEPDLIEECTCGQNFAFDTVLNQ
ncbi:hypothetical protein [Flavobacterium microcysteis]|uniref:Cthe-2314-like HEPN domain-containing protein n=1 Tax=Flavobacterium microcysteis TaxID=2596891 RepID=A0A501QNB4_9FLAO|nr:hypothetical protein [Flavobacterium microcysteis]TPD73751.1 hypothetical protein FJA49_00205 [Flavobacterium microcysteis]